jgi:threonine/homoserine/homoserine lactone efflux protein
LSSDIKIGELPTRLKRNRAIILLAIFLLVVITVLAVALYLHPEIKDDPLFFAILSEATLFPFFYLVWQILKSDKPGQEPRKGTKEEKAVDPLPGPYTNVTGGVQGDVLSGNFNGPTGVNPR